MWRPTVHGATQVAVPHRAQAENGHVGRLLEVRKLKIGAPEYYCVRAEFPELSL